MLKEPLHQRYVKSVGIVDFGCVPLAEAVGTDTLIAQIVTYNPKLLLYCPFCDRENQLLLLLTEKTSATSLMAI